MARYENYIVEVKCNNCRMVKRMKFKVGSTVENTNCPRCGMKSLHPLGYYSDPTPGK